MRNSTLGVMIAIACLISAADAAAIPYFARRYNVSCHECHVAPPKLNAFGQAFVDRGYELPNTPTKGTWPFALWLSGRAESLPGGSLSDETVSYVNRVELISGGSLTSWLSYFLEWRPLSKEARANGTLRDRSGRFEDLFVIASVDHLEVTAGQFRQLAQVDVSQRLGIHEPLVLSASLAGLPGGTAREQSLRAFSPSGRSPSIRMGWRQPLRAGKTWTISAALPIPGEFSIPLSDSAEVEASNEIEWRAKGAFVESYVRKGLLSVGAHVFYDNSERYLANVIGTGNLGAFHALAIFGAAKRLAPGTTTRDLYGQWTLQTEFAPHRLFAVGGRIEDRAADGAARAFLPYVNVHFPGTKYTVRLTAEHRFQRDRAATFFELGSVF